MNISANFKNCYKLFYPIIHVSCGLFLAFGLLLLSAAAGIADPMFHARIDYNLELDVGTFAAGDFDSDGDVDIAVTLEKTTNISVLLNNGDDTFQDPVMYGVGQNPSHIQKS